MQKQIQSFINDLKSNKRLSSFDEAATKQAVVLRLLSLLGWDIFNVEEVYPGYAVNSSNISYALRIGGINKIFIEVKKIGEKLDDYQKAFLDLAAEGEPDFAVLTDGIIWWFYLMSSHNNWQQKWFYSADFFNQDPDAFVSRLAGLLTMDKVTNGQALKTAKNLFHEKNQKIAADFLPQAWNQIISQPNNVFVELLSVQTEKMCGYKVDIKSIETFLSDHVDKWLLTDTGGTLTAAPDTVMESGFSDAEDTPTPSASGGDYKDKKERKSQGYADKSIKSFTFIGHSHIVRAWEEVLAILCDYFASAHEKDFEKVLWISDDQKPYFSRYSDQLRIPEKIQGTDIYVETRMNPDEVVRTAYKLIAAFGYGNDDLSIDAR